MVNSHVKEVINLRNSLCEDLKELKFQVYPTGSNFIFTKAPVDKLFEKLMECGVLIREFDFNGEIYYRITVGTEEENKILIEEIKNIINK